MKFGHREGAKLTLAKGEVALPQVRVVGMQKEELLPLLGQGTGFPELRTQLQLGELQVYTAWVALDGPL